MKRNKDHEHNLKQIRAEIRYGLKKYQDIQRKWHDLKAKVWLKPFWLKTGKPHFGFPNRPFATNIFQSHHRIISTKTSPKTNKNSTASTATCNSVPVEPATTQKTERHWHIWRLASIKTAVFKRIQRRPACTTQFLHWFLWSRHPTLYKKNKDPKKETKWERATH